MLNSLKFWCGPWLILALFLPAGTAIAQSDKQPQEAPQVPLFQDPVLLSNEPADRLAANLVLLARNPKDVNTLTEAGKGAIAIGDGDAALSFLARAEELAPTDGRIKAALGSALLLVERPTDALRLFEEARALGVPDATLAADRGLAYDLRGENKRAQRDYQLALRQTPSDEVTRRLALSLGMSGDRDAALRTLDPLIRKQDPTGWRARAFVLAMNNDVRGAEAIAARVMPAGMSETMEPFLRRLATLNASERALAVNFGIMPSEGTRFASAAKVTPSAPIRSTGTLIPADNLTSASAGDPIVTARKAEPISKAERRRPGREDVALASVPQAVNPSFSDIPAKITAQPATILTPTPKPIEVATPGTRLDQRVGKRIGPVDPERIPADVRILLAKNDPVPLPEVRQVAESVFAMRAPVQAAVIPQKPLIKPEPEEFDQPPKAVFEVAAVPVVKPAPIVETKVAQAVLPPEPVKLGVVIAAPEKLEALKPVPLPAAAIVDTPPPPPILAPLAPAAAVNPVGLATIMADITPENESVAAPLPSTVEVKIAKLAVQRKFADAAAKVKSDKDALAKAEKNIVDRKAAEAAALAKRNPARVWVQIATGSNEAGLGLTWKRVKEKSPDILKGVGGAYTPFKATNRVLAGPFKSSAEARNTVNILNKAGVSATIFSSETGQEISKIASK